jgi:hypothetical protein
MVVDAGRARAPAQPQFGWPLCSFYVCTDSEVRVPEALDDKEGMLQKRKTLECLSSIHEASSAIYVVKVKLSSIQI